MSTPPEKLAASIGHQCQNDHGVLADVAIVQLATAETDMLCQPCLVAFMSAVIGQVVNGLSDAELEASDPVAVAAKAAADALAANPAG